MLDDVLGDRKIDPDRYFRLDRATKLVAAILLTMAFVPEFLPQYSLFLGIIAIIIGSVTIVLNPDEQQSTTD